MAGKNSCSEAEMEANHAACKASSGRMSMTEKLAKEQKYKAPSQISGRIPSGKKK